MLHKRIDPGMLHKRIDPGMLHKRIECYTRELIM